MMGYCDPKTYPFDIAHTYLSSAVVVTPLRIGFSDLQEYMNSCSSCFYKRAGLDPVFGATCQPKVAFSTFPL